MDADIHNPKPSNVRKWTRINGVVYYSFKLEDTEGSSVTVYVENLNEFILSLAREPVGESAASF